MLVARFVLNGLLLFNAVTAAAGGIGLISGLVAPPMDMLKGTPFNDYFVPGLILLLVVGGSSFIAAMATIRRTEYAEIVAFMAGVVMAGWIAGEVMMIQVFSWLQALYFTTGLLVAVLGYVLDEKKNQRNT